MGHEDVSSAVRTPHRQTEYGVVKSTLRANDNTFQGFFKRVVNRRLGARFYAQFHGKKACRRRRRRPNTKAISGTPAGS
jgi:hypothetical protein